MESVSESHAPSWNIKVHNDVYIARPYRSGTSIQSLLDYLIWIDRRYHSRKRTIGNTGAIHTKQYRLNIWISFTSSVACRPTFCFQFGSNHAWVMQFQLMGLTRVCDTCLLTTHWLIVLFPCPKKTITVDLFYCPSSRFPFTFYVFPSFVSISFVKPSLSSAGGSIFCLYLSLATLTFTFSLNGASRFKNCNGNLQALGYSGVQKMVRV